MPESFVAEPSFRFHPSVLDAAAPLYLHGYWQSSAYFEDCAATIRTDFTFAERLDEANQRFAREMRGVPSVSVHVRRGDYVNNPKGRSVYAECTRQYYSVAMNRMLSIHPGAHFFAFSDDPAWVRDKLCPEFRQMDIIEHNRDRKSYLDMRLMSSCRHHIIANSTFSWWGAWLNPDPDKMVIAPTRWFATSIDSKDLIPDTWICV